MTPYNKTQNSFGLYKFARLQTEIANCEMQFYGEDFEMVQNISASVISSLLLTKEEEDSIGKEDKLNLSLLSQAKITIAEGALQSISNAMPMNNRNIAEAKLRSDEYKSLLSAVSLELMNNGIPLLSKTISLSELSNSTEETLNNLILDSGLKDTDFSVLRTKQLNQLKICFPGNDVAEGKIFNTLKSILELEPEVNILASGEVVNDFIVHSNNCSEADKETLLNKSISLFEGEHIFFDHKDTPESLQFHDYLVASSTLTEKDLLVNVVESNDFYLKENKDKFDKTYNKWLAQEAMQTPRLDKESEFSNFS